MKMMNVFRLGLGVAILLSSLSLNAATTITIVNADSPGEGFNDPTPVAPVGGNPGTTLGQQRLNVFQYAADQWASRIDSNVEIRVSANFDPLSCNATSAVLGAAGTTTVHRDFAGAPLSATWYPQALANALAGEDLSPTNPDLGATFNSAIDNNNTCLIGTNWYLGLDGNNNGDIDLANVVLHEIGHGLGFASYVDETTGQGFLNYLDIFSRQLEDHSTGLTWSQMTNNQRKASAIDTGDLHFVGLNIVNTAGHVAMYAPNPVEPGSSVSHFDTSLSPEELMEPRYTASLHTIGLAYEAMQDIGWQPANQSGNTPPQITLTSPSTGAEFAIGSDVSLQASASDAEDGDLDTSIAWTSDLDGDLGTGASLTVNWLQTGDHLITARVTDSQGISSEAQASITVMSETALPPAAPSNVAVTDLANGSALISWSDNSDNEDQFDILRESPHKKRPGIWTGSTLVATVPADTVSYTDASGEGTFRYCISATNSSGSSASVCSEATAITGGGSSGGGSGGTFCDAHPDNKRCQ